MSQLPPLKAVWYFEAAARLLSFSRAGDELSVTHSAISHQIKALEDWLGQPLFDRGARSLKLTEAGRRFLPPVGSAFQQLAQAADDVRMVGKSGPLTVSVLPSLAAKWLVPRLYDFRARHPEIEVRISATERLEQVGQADIDVGIRYGGGHWPDLTAELMLKDDLFPVCSPRLLTCDRPLAEPRDIASFTLLSDYDWRNARFDMWSKWLEKAGLAEHDLKAGFTFNFSNLMIQAAIEGLGVALANTMLAGDDLRAGRLVKPFDLSVDLETGYYLVYGKGALKRPKIAAFRNWLMEQIEPFRKTEEPA